MLSVADELDLIAKILLYIYKVTYSKYLLKAIVGPLRDSTIWLDEAFKFNFAEYKTNCHSLFLFVNYANIVHHL